MNEQTTKSGISTGMAIGIAVIVAIVFGGGSYVYVNNKAEKEKKDLNAQITELQSQVSGATATTTTTSSASASATAVTDETASWKTYTGNIYGQNTSFKYPSDWTVTRDEKSTGEPGYLIQLQNKSKTQLNVNIWQTSEVAPATLEQEKSDLTQTAKSGGFNVSFSDITIGGQQGIKITFSNLSDVEKEHRANPQAAVVKNGIFYSFEPFNSGTTELDQILSTLQFTSK